MIQYHEYVKANETRLTLAYKSGKLSDFQRTKMRKASELIETYKEQEKGTKTVATSPYETTCKCGHTENVYLNTKSYKSPYHVIGRCSKCSTIIFDETIKANSTEDIYNDFREISLNNI